MTEHCEACGQPLPRGVSAPAPVGVWLDDPASVANPGFDDVVGRSAGSDSNRDHGPGGNRRWLGIGVALIAVWLVVVGLGRVTSPDEVANPIQDMANAGDESAGEQPTAAPTSTAVPTPGPTQTPSIYFDASTTSIDIDQLGASQPGTTVQVDRLARQLGRRGSDAILAYRSRGGVVLVDLAAGIALASPAQAQVEDSGLGIATTLERLVEQLMDSDDEAFFSTGVDLFAIDRTTLSVRTLADDGSRVVTVASTGIHYWLPGPGLQGQASQAVRIDGSRVGRLRVPGGPQLILADGLGVLAVGKGPLGSTLIAGAEGFGPFSDHRVFDANAVAALEQVCEVDECSFQVRDLASGEVAPVPAEFIDIGDRFILSPDGRKVLRTTPYGFAEIYDLDDQNVAWVAGGQLHQAAWGPDSSFVAWLDVLGSELAIMFVDERDWLTIPLGVGGAYQPLGDDLVVFSPSGDEPAESAD